MSPKELVLNAFRNVLENPNATLCDLEKYFSVEYKQSVDGKALDYSAFTEHFIALTKAVRSFNVDVRDIMSEGNRVFTHHVVHMIKNNGDEVVMKVLALFDVEDGKIIACDELTHILKGNSEDHDLGSRTR
jgi:limonene-1,2-epoxide hydrolase